MQDRVCVNQENTLRAMAICAGTGAGNLSTVCRLNKTLGRQEAEAFVCDLTDAYPALLLQKDERNRYNLCPEAKQICTEDFSEQDEKALQIRLQQLADTPTSICRAPLFMCRVFLLPNQKSAIFFRVSRLIADPVSVSLLMRYTDAYFKGNPKTKPDTWLLSLLSSPPHIVCDKETVAYLKGRVRTKVPLVHQRLHGHTAGSVSDTAVPVSPSSLMAAYAALQYRLTKETTQMLILNRNRRAEDTKDTFGPFTDAMPIVLHIDDNKTLSEVKEQLEEEIVRTEKLPPLYLAHTPIPEEAAAAAFYLAPSEQTTGWEWVHALACERPLHITLTPNNGGTAWSAVYAKEYDSEESVRALMRRLRLLCETPNTPIGELTLTDARDLGAWEAFQKKEPSQAAVSVLAQLAKEAKTRPNDTAITEENKTMTYRELYQKSGAVAGMLYKKGIKKGSIVGIMMRKGRYLPVAMFGVLLCGAAFYLIEPSASHREREIAFSQADAVIADAGLHIEGALLVENASPADALFEDLSDPESVACLIKTAKTSKTVCLSGHALALTMQWMSETLPLSGTLLQKEPVTDAAAVWELLSPAYGVRLVMLRDQNDDRYEEIYRHIENERVTTLFFMPSRFAAYAAWLNQTKRHHTAVDTVFFYGEQIDRYHIGRAGVFLKNAKLICLYGAAEGILPEAAYHVQGGEETIPLGTPAYRTALYVVDDTLRLLPPEAVGRILVVDDPIGFRYVQDNEGFVRYQGKPAFLTDDYGVLKEDGQLYFICKKADWIIKNGCLFPINRAVHAAFSLLGTIDAKCVFHQNSWTLFYTAEEKISHIRTLLSAHLLPEEMPDQIVYRAIDCREAGETFDGESPVEETATHQAWTCLREDAENTLVLAFCAVGRGADTLQKIADDVPFPCVFLAVDMPYIEGSADALIREIVLMTGAFSSLYIMGFGEGSPAAVKLAQCATQKDAPLKKLLLVSPVRAKEALLLTCLSERKAARLFKKRNEASLPCDLYQAQMLMCRGFFTGEKSAKMPIRAAVVTSGIKPFSTQDKVYWRLAFGRTFDLFCEGDRFYFYEDTSLPPAVWEET